MQLKNYYLPILAALCIVLGIFLGKSLNNKQQALGNAQNRAGGKLQNVLQYLQNEYVDTLNAAKLEDKAIENILAELDPHSVYIPRQETEAANEGLEGSFSGIGIEFNLLNDTIIVISPISGGPAERLGIMPGDKIIDINQKPFSGTGISNEKVFKTLRGKQGTQVLIKVKRMGFKKLLPFNITRDKIPLKSVDASYLIDKNVGYIKINKFAATTHQEFVTAIEQLKAGGVVSLILDLRGNAGGFLNEAVELCDEFLPKGDKIVYTQGKAQPRQDYIARSNGLFESGKVIILIDEGSASASEIVAGAIQDNDRGLVIGRRSFGKGLVQERIPFADGAEMRLTIARYYTPSGRCIQKPYDLGNAAAYYEMEESRFKRGEYTSADSIKINKSLVYKTKLGKMVYGGGGILPDVFIGLDTSKTERAFVETMIKHNVQSYCLAFANKHREEIKKLGASGFNKSALKQDLLKSFLMQNKIIGLATESENRLLVYLQANVSRLVFDQNEFYRIINSNDKTVQSAIKSIYSKG